MCNRFLLAVAWAGIWICLLGGEGWAKGVQPIIEVAALPGAQEKALIEADPAWSALGLLPGLAEREKKQLRFDINQKTRFYAFFIDKARRWVGKRVVFIWRHGNPLKPYGIPVAVRVRRAKGVGEPVAMHSIWSDPPGSSGLLGGLGLGSVKSRKKWENSRCYGPRRVSVHELAGYVKGRGGRRLPRAGRLLAEAQFEVLPHGVAVY